MAKKPTPDWKQFTEEVSPVTTPAPTHDPPPAPAAATPPEAHVSPTVKAGPKETFSTYVPVGTRLALRELALRLTRQRGTAVSVTDLAGEAFDDLFRKYDAS